MNAVPELPHSFVFQPLWKYGWYKAIIYNTYSHSMTILPKIKEINNECFNNIRQAGQTVPNIHPDRRQWNCAKIPWMYGPPYGIRVCHMVIHADYKNWLWVCRTRNVRVRICLEVVCSMYQNLKDVIHVKWIIYDLKI